MSARVPVSRDLSGGGAALHWIKVCAAPAESGLYAAERFGTGCNFKLGRSINIRRRSHEFGSRVRVRFVCLAPPPALVEIERQLFDRCPFPLGGGWGREWLRCDGSALWAWLEKEIYQ